MGGDDSMPQFLRPKGHAAPYAQASNTPPSRAGTRSRAFGAYNAASMGGSRPNTSSQSGGRVPGLDGPAEGTEASEAEAARVAGGRRTLHMASPYLQPPPRSSQGTRAGMQGVARRTDDRHSPVRLSSPNSSMGGRQSTPPHTTQAPPGRVSSPLAAAPADTGRQKLLQAYGVARTTGPRVLATRDGFRSSPRDHGGIGGLGSGGGRHTPAPEADLPAPSHQQSSSRPTSSRPTSSRPTTARPGSARPTSARPGSAARNPALSSSLTIDDIPEVTDYDHTYDDEDEAWWAQALVHHRNPPQQQQQQQQGWQEGRQEGRQEPEGEAAGYGMTLDQYMSRMVTTPASAAATSGLGQIAGSSNETSPKGHGVHDTPQRPPSSGRYPHPHPHHASQPPPYQHFPPAPGQGTSRHPVGSPGSGQGPFSGTGQEEAAGEEAGSSPANSIPSSPILTRVSPGSGWGGAASGGSRENSGKLPRQGSGARGGPSVAASWDSGPGGPWRSPSWRTPGPDQALDVEYSQESLTASALALSNSLDLRPATAAVQSSDRGSAGASTRGQDPFSGHDGHHGDFIKHTDLGGLSSALFTPSAATAQRTVGGSGAGSGSGELGVGGMRTSAGRRGSGALGLDELGNRLSSGGPGASDGSGAGSVPMGKAPAGKAGMLGSSGQGGGVRDSWAMRTSGAESPPSPPAPQPEADWRAGEETLVSRGMRMVQSARPVTRHGQELDPSVWQARIAAQLERPPSRQKPPPEALHLWAPGEHVDAVSPAPNGVRQRPHTASAASYGGRMGAGIQARPNGPGLGFGGHGAGLGMRPPTRQKPPPMSVLLEHSRTRGGTDAMDLGPLSEDSEADLI